MIPEQILNPKGCGKDIFYEPFTKPSECGKGHGVNLRYCENCQNIQRAQAQVLLDEKKNSKIKELFNKFDEYSCIKDDKWYLEFKEVVLQELQEEIKVLEGLK